MKKKLITAIILMLTVCTLTTTQTYAAKRPSIKKVAKTYVVYHLKGYKYESPYELLEENGYKANKKNVKTIKKHLKYYFRKYK